MKSNDERIDEIISKLEPVIGEDKAKLLWFLYHSNSHQKRFIESLARLMSSEYINDAYTRKEILLSPPPAEKADGEYPLGIVYYGKKPLYRFGLKEDEWIQHVGIFGRSGSGKTSAALIIVWNMMQAGKPFLVFDWKRNYRDMLIHNDSIRVFTAGRSVAPFFFNPLIPPDGIETDEWIMRLVDVMCHAFFLGEGVQHILSKAMQNVYAQKGIYEGQKDYPLFIDVYREVLKYTGKFRKTQWLESAERSLYDLAIGKYAIFPCRVLLI